MSRPDKYKRIGVAPSNSIDTNSEQTLFCQQTFVRGGGYSTLGVTVLPTGVYYKWSLPGTVRKHRFWIAAGVAFKSKAADVWYFIGRLNFYRANRPVGSYDFDDCDTRAGGALLTDKLRITAKPLADGSAPLPAIRYGVFNSTDVAGADIYYLDVPCVEIEILADRVEYEILQAQLGLTDPASLVYTLTGCRIVSTA
jgi:hypothetical protein